MWSNISLLMHIGQFNKLSYILKVCVLCLQMWDEGWKAQTWNWCRGPHVVGNHWFSNCYLRMMCGSLVSNPCLHWNYYLFLENLFISVGNFAILSNISNIDVWSLYTKNRAFSQFSTILLWTNKCQSKRQKLKVERTMLTYSA